MNDEKSGIMLANGLRKRYIVLKNLMVGSFGEEVL